MRRCPSQAELSHRAISIALVIIVQCAAALSLTSGETAPLAAFAITVSSESFSNPAPVEISLGAVRASQVVPFRFTIHQNHAEPVTVGKLVPSCPCVDSTPPSSPIAPGTTVDMDCEWYVGPGHGKRSISMSMPMKDGSGKTSSLTVLANATVTDLVGMDFHGRFVDVGPVDVSNLESASTATSTFQKTSFRAWDTVRVVRSSGLMPLQLTEPSPGEFALSAIPSQIADRAHLRLGVFSEDAFLGFAKGGVDLPETIRYRVSAKFLDARFRLIPDQLFAGKQSKTTRPPENAVGTVLIRGFTPISIMHHHTVYDYNGDVTSKETTPFRVSIEQPSTKVASWTIAVTLANADDFDRATLLRCDRACSRFTVFGTAPNGAPISYSLPVYFTVDP